ncbi:arylamine N-acetyltransferase family protein [Croceitalea rosinachiae]|uniref:Arylamine N-acetyltransferase n=1 Tax=Croceitalea rosinachiae TaxID=3075596 RepID=A0ABU3A808_9FLAO|nr:arylamine N-acetyltransferase [Croceitalea sp. F388]MDT0606018.1 arylamine N-acetyltransferase [Croceitalea sp. F388]
MSFKKEKYLQKINCSGNLEPNLNNLKELQRHHLLNIPFENLDIHNNISIELSIDRIFDKVVNQNRGGFCYELNGLFYELLNAIGFDVKMISARVFNQDKGYGKEYDHLAIIAKINGIEYLTDIGFGEFTFEPLRLQLETIQNDERGDFKIDKYENGYFRVNKIENKKQTPEYIFKNKKRKLTEFEEMSNYHQTSPNSHFTSKRLISLQTENGRITITGNKLKIKELDLTTEILLENEAEFKKELWVKFKVKI